MKNVRIMRQEVVNTIPTVFTKMDGVRVITTSS